MPYLFDTPNGFTLIHSTAKNGVFYQSFTSPPYKSKPIQIFAQSPTSYSACMDATNRLHVAILLDAFYLNYYSYENNHFEKNTLASNPNSNDMLFAPTIYNLSGQSSFSIAYLSHQMHTEVYNFIVENPYKHQQSVLLTLSTCPYFIKSYTTFQALWIFFITSDTYYHLHALHITDSEAHFCTYLNLNEPIIDYSICIAEDFVHVTYVSELNGKYQVSYFNTHYRKLTHLLITNTPCYPTVFSYYNMIWVHMMINRQLQMMLSIDDGQSFSTPTPCSIQNNVYRSFFFTQRDSPFIGQELYASIGSTLKLCTLALIDFPRFHLDTHIAPELELLVEGFLLSLENSKTQSALSVPCPPLAPEASSTVGTVSKHTLNTSSLDQAKNDFMQDLSGWELPPKI